MKKQPDLDDFFTGDLVLPWKGRDWVIPEPTAKESERLQALVYSDELTGPREIYEIRKLMGQTWHDLVEAGIGWSHLLHIGRTALIYFTGTPEMAHGHWTLGRLALAVDLDAVIAEQAKLEQLKKARARLVAEAVK